MRVRHFGTAGDHQVAPAAASTYTNARPNMAKHYSP